MTKKETKFRVVFQQTEYRECYIRASNLVAAERKARKLARVGMLDAGRYVDSENQKVCYVDQDGDV